MKSSKALELIALEIRGWGGDWGGGECGPGHP